ncbi:MAG TPA: serine/threonine-protein kinase [Ktedonosporobacter sp.]|nr:serine/threonine-protein kinase [Ktedonosporobacter sp.]
MADRIGQQPGNYRLTQLLGYGGFAEVYLGEHVHLETKAAVKVLRAQLSDKEIEQFRVEARTIAHLKHPHIIRILEFGVEDTTPFLIMDYAPNGSLRQRHPRDTQLPLHLVVSYVQQIASALQYAHEQKVVHRDIKPENILVGDNNEILLSDFGIATIVHSQSSLKTEAYSGTPHYSAPEQIEGKPRPASDQYALGIIVYEWLTGSLPFTGDIAQLIYQQIHSDPPPMCEKLSTIHPDVEQVVLQALAKSPEKRFASVQAFAAALEQASQDTVVSPAPSQHPTVISEPQTQPIEPLPSPNPAPTQRVHRVRPVRLYVLVGLALLIILVGSLAFFAFRGNNPQSSPPTLANGISRRQTNTATSTFTATAPVTATMQVPATATPPQAIATLNAASSNPYPPHTGQLAVNDSLKSSVGGGWDTSTNCQFIGDAYHVSLGTKANACLYASGTYSNLVYQAQMIFVTDNTCGGLIFGESDTFLLSYYDFYICTDGTYHLDQFSALGTPLRNGASDAIQATPGQANIIAVVSNGRSLDLYINNQHIATVSVSSNSGGQIGFFAGDMGGSSGPAEVAFNNVKVWTL